MIKQQPRNTLPRKSFRKELRINGQVKVKVLRQRMLQTWPRSLLILVLLILVSLVKFPCIRKSKLLAKNTTGIMFQLIKMKTALFGKFTLNQLAN